MVPPLTATQTCLRSASAGVDEVQRVIQRIGVHRGVVAEKSVPHDKPWSLQPRFRLEVSADARVVVSVPVLKEVSFGIEVLPRKSGRGPEGLRAGLVTPVLVTLDHDVSIRKIRSLRAGASAARGNEAIRVRRLHAQRVKQSHSTEQDNGLARLTAFGEGASTEVAGGRGLQPRALRMKTSVPRWIRSRC